MNLQSVQLLKGVLCILGWASFQDLILTGHQSLPIGSFGPVSSAETVSLHPYTWKDKKEKDKSEKDKNTREKNCFGITFYFCLYALIQ